MGEPLSDADLAAIADAVAPAPVRRSVASAASVCADCDSLILPGMQIVKRPGRAWAHRNCSKRARRRASED